MKLLVCLFALPFLFSFKFNPMSQSIELPSDNPHAQFLLENDSNEKMAIELTVTERIMDVNGEEKLPKTSEIILFPPQMIIPPKEKRTVRVSWKGPKNLDSERAFRVIAEQLPLNVDEKTKRRTGIQMLMKYMAALYVTPSDVKAELKTKLQSSSPGKLHVEVTNTGKKHKILISPVLQLSKGNKKWELQGDELKGLASENVLAGKTRLFKLDYPEVVPPDAEAKLKVDD